MRRPFDVSYLIRLTPYVTPEPDMHFLRGERCKSATLACSHFAHKEKAASKRKRPRKSNSG